MQYGRTPGTRAWKRGKTKSGRTTEGAKACQQAREENRVLTEAERLGLLRPPSFRRRRATWGPNAFATTEAVPEELEPPDGGTDPG
jgi:hypothetical protein